MRTPCRGGEPRWALVVAVGVALVVLALGPAAGIAGAAVRRTPTLAPDNTVVDGPSASIVSLDGMSIARDGTGGLVYLKDVGGVAHVFVSRLLGGVYQAPVQVDAGLPGGSSQPVIAAANTGVLLVAFINAGQLEVVSFAGATSGPTAPGDLFSGALNPSISMSNFGKAYVAFTDTGAPGGGAVRTAFYYLGQWALESAPLNANPADPAGLGSGRPRVATAGDGIAIVIWGEDGHIYTRRVVGTTPSVVYEQADPAQFDGWSEQSVADPVIASGGDSTYASVAFQETLTNGSLTQTRVLAEQLKGEIYQYLGAADGASTGGPEGADEPATAVTEYGAGFVTSEGDVSHELFATTLAQEAIPSGLQRVDSLPNDGAGDAVPATAGLYSMVIAWQQDPGIAGPAEIRVRYAPDGVDLNPEQVVSVPTDGATDGNLGLFAAGDVSGDTAVAWVQGSGTGTEIVAAQLFQAPGGFDPELNFAYARTDQPMLAWTAANELWGAPDYTLRVDGAPVAQTTALATTTSALTNGRHTYQVTATNLAGLTSAASAATVFVDTIPPAIAFHVTGSRIVRTAVHLHIRVTDPAPPGQSSAAASGIASAVVHWGDATQSRVRGRSLISHVYSRRRTYTITVTAADRAGNQTVVAKPIAIKAKPKPKPKRKRKKRHGSATTRKATRR